MVMLAMDHEPIDPVRYIANRSSGKQGHAIATALAQAGAEVILVSGPVIIPDPRGVETIHVETAREMQKMVEAALPADIGVFVAAVADWRTVNSADEKMKKEGGKGPSSLKLTDSSRFRMVMLAMDHFRHDIIDFNDCISYNQRQAAVNCR